MSKIHVDIVSAEGEIYAGEAAMVFAPARLGDIGIAPRHAPLLTSLRPGEIRVQPADGGEEEFFFVSGGMLEVQPHLVTVLADTALRAHDLDEAAALEAKRRAEESLRDQKDEVDLAVAQSELIEAAAMLQAIQKLRKRRR
ncbi:MAG: F0F1 ATP synthase subunit epsilon [Gammaproteobacteria bacterium]|nr:F0F1 ATP synthase subunit epsilon [Gammaproteobacteria bacterium]MDH3766816.1 F0F1 ATP synthase subunit epsilon [Gammaproteobacteria bacterium]